MRFAKATHFVARSWAVHLSRGGRPHLATQPQILRHHLIDTDVLPDNADVDRSPNTPAHHTAHTLQTS